MLLGSNHLFSAEMACIQIQDIDIVVSKEKTDAEDIKEAIAGADNRYYLERSRKRGATHQILYCRLPGRKTDPERCVNVDILVPPTLGLPEIPDINGHLEVILFGWIPVMPIFDLLVMKTQGWWDHRTSPRSDFRGNPCQGTRRCIRHIRPLRMREGGESLLRR